MEPTGQGRRLSDLARLFLKLGTTAFGGPAAHIAMMEREVVRHRQWLAHEEFLDLLGAANLIPGPNSTEMAIHIGYRRAGWSGLLVAGSCFILPAALLVTLIAWAYVKYSSLPPVAGLFYGIKPVIIVVVLQALWRLGRTAVKNRSLALAGIAGAGLNYLGVNELVILFGTELLMMTGRLAWRPESRSQTGTKLFCLPFIGVIPGAVTTGTVAAAPFSLWLLGLFFLKVGSVLFGSGYVLLAFLRADLVERWHWLSQNQLMDAIAVGQFTPGPVFTTATFIGYVLDGPTGALVATVGIFLPAFVFVALSVPLLPRLRRSPAMGAFLDGVNVASLALMAVVTWQLGAVALVDWPTIGLATVAAMILLRYEINSIWLVLGGALVGWAVTSLFTK